MIESNVKNKAILENQLSNISARLADTREFLRQSDKAIKSAISTITKLQITIEDIYITLDDEKI